MTEPQTSYEPGELLYRSVTEEDLLIKNRSWGELTIGKRGHWRRAEQDLVRTLQKGIVIRAFDGSPDSATTLLLERVDGLL